MESRVKVELIGVISLTLESGYELVLENALFVLSMRRNLISVSILDKAGYIHDAKWSHFMEKCETNSLWQLRNFMRETVYHKSSETNDLMNSIIGSIICILWLFTHTPFHIFSYSHYLFTVENSCHVCEYVL